MLPMTMAARGWSVLLVLFVQMMAFVKSEDTLLSDSRRQDINESSGSYYQLSPLTIVTIGLVCAVITLTAGAICLTCLKVDRRPVKYHVKTRRHIDRRPVHSQHMAADKIIYVATPPQQPQPQYMLINGRHSQQGYHHYYPQDTRAVTQYTTGNSSVRSHNTSIASSQNRHSITNAQQYHRVENAHPPKTLVSLKEYETHSLTMFVPEEDEDIIIPRANGNRI